MMARIMLTFCIQYKSSKTTYDLFTVNDFGPHTNLIFLGGGGDLYTERYIREYIWYIMSCVPHLMTKKSQTRLGF